MGFSVRLFHVRKGQFVYYQNKLHKVYSVKAFFKRSVHLIRLEDFEQVLTTAAEIELYKPQHLDSFIFNHKRYTLHKDVKATIGDYIIVTNPSPDYIDQHHLHAIEMVAAIEKNGIITNKANGIKHHEYWVMVPKLLEGAKIIDFKHLDSESTSGGEDEDEQQPSSVQAKIRPPQIGDVYQKNNSQPILQAMVVAIQGDTNYLGSGIKLTTKELTESNKWSFMYNILE